ncbi:hypothetical protein ACFE04_029641 [Oxalis oulophora]
MAILRFVFDGGGALLPMEARAMVKAAVRVVLSWSTWPIVPMLTWGSADDQGGGVMKEEESKGLELFVVVRTRETTVVVVVEAYGCLSLEATSVVVVVVVGEEIEVAAIDELKRERIEFWI